MTKSGIKMVQYYQWIDDSRGLLGFASRSERYLGTSLPSPLPAWDEEISYLILFLTN